MVYNVVITVDAGFKSLKFVEFVEPSGCIKDGGLAGEGEQDILANRTGDLRSFLLQVLEKEIA